MENQPIKKLNQPINPTEQRYLLLQRLAKSDVFVTNQQRSETPHTINQRYEILSKIFDEKPGLFIERYKDELNINDLLAFEDSYKNNSLVNYIYEDLKSKFQSLNSATKKETNSNVLVKNRRFVAMQKLIEKGEYFSEISMKSRDPNLYEELVGQYLTHDEVLEISKTNHNNGSNTLSEILLKQIDMANEKKLFEDQKASEYYGNMDDNTPESETNSVCSDESEYSNDLNDKKETKALTDTEKMHLKQEFFARMQEKFLSGDDKDFDYSKIDNDYNNDPFRLMELDEQDKYFDNEIPTN